MSVGAAIAVLAVGTFALRGLGPVLLRRVPMPPRVQAAISLVAPALLAALVAVSTTVDGRSLVLDARAAGVAVAALAAWRRLPFVAVIVAAVVTTAGIRALA